MTLNGHFASKSSPNSAGRWRSGFWRKLFGNLQSYAYTVSGKNVAQLVLYVKCSPACTGDIRVMELFTGIREQEASNQLTVFTVLHSQFSHMLFTDACRK